MDDEFEKELRALFGDLGVEGDDADKLMDVVEDDIVSSAAQEMPLNDDDITFDGGISLDDIASIDEDSSDKSVHIDDDVDMDDLATMFGIGQQDIASIEEDTSVDSDLETSFNIDDIDSIMDIEEDINARLEDLTPTSHVDIDDDDISITSLGFSDGDQDELVADSSQAPSSIAIDDDLDLSDLSFETSKGDSLDLDLLDESEVVTSQDDDIFDADLDTYELDFSQYDI